MVEERQATGPTMIERSRRLVVDNERSSGQRTNEGFIRANTYSMFSNRS
jgi:hypothetical protein